MYRYRFTGDSPKQWARGVLAPGDEVESDEPLYNGDLEHIGGPKPPPWQADVNAPVAGSGKGSQTLKAEKATTEPGAQPETTPKEG